MLKVNNKKLIILTLLFLIVLILGSFRIIKFVYAQNNEETIEIPQNFILDEYSKNNGTNENKDSINIPLPSSDWNLTDINLNFTNINFTRQILEIENGSAFYGEQGLKANQACGVQINITDPTRIYGVSFKSRVFSPSPIEDIAYIQLCGFNQSSNRPNNTIYKSERISTIEATLGWVNITFSSFKDLFPGNYSLVLNVTYTKKTNTKYYWADDYYNPKHPELYISQFDGSTWTDGTQETPYLYKLNQTIITDFYPETFNMYAEINNSPRKIYNGTEPGTGKLSLSGIDFAPNDNNLLIPINIDKPYTFIFNLSYNISLKNEFIADSSVLVSENSENHWKVKFNAERTNGNYTIKFLFPRDWENCTIFKDTEPIISNYTIDYNENLIYILNGTFPPGISSWEIRADSFKVNFDLDVPATEFKIGEELQFGLFDPILHGNYTFLLYNQLGFEKVRNLTAYQGGAIEPIFTYSVPSDAISGTWKAYIYWNNKTDAGLETQEFSIIGISPLLPGNGGGGNGGRKIVTGIDPLLIFIVSLIIIIAVVAGLVSYQTVKRTKAKRELYLKKLHNKFMDILSLNYIMILDKKSGINVYEQFFAGKLIDATLISGFLEAIRNFGIELTGTYQQSQTVKLEYQNSKILMSEFREFRVILVLKENVSDEFITSINALSYDIETQYGQELKDFKGKTSVFEDIKTLIEKHLNISFISPLKVFELPNIELSPTEQSMINKAKSIMKQNNLDFFYTTFLMEDQKFDPKKTKAIFNLIEKKIFQPISLPSGTGD